MRKVVFDIETSNEFSEVGKFDLRLLDISIVGVYDSEKDSYRAYLVEELVELWPIIEKTDVLIGYNSDHFDIPLLNKYYHGDLATIKSVDLLKEIKNSLGKRLKLDSVAEATLGVNKSGHGLDAIKWWRDGEVEKVKKYCLDDVKITKDLYDYALKNGHLKYKDWDGIKTIELDTSNWEEKEDSALTHTLPF
ncbi:MAG: ribonuclease H-like domain-containing protein [Parcubacteria group bacterium]|nr:ribonuclease H-like domain-containing protein [Parcubacteria group bacterium]